MKKLLNDLNYLDSILEKGFERANEISEKNIKELKKIIGFFEHELLSPNCRYPN